MGGSELDWSVNGGLLEPEVDDGAPLGVGD